MPFVELIAGGLMLAGWMRWPAALGLGGVLILVTFGHLLAEPLFAFKARACDSAHTLAGLGARALRGGPLERGWIARAAPGGETSAESLTGRPAD